MVDGKADLEGRRVWKEITICCHHVIGGDGDKRGENRGGTVMRHTTVILPSKAVP